MSKYRTGSVTPDTAREYEMVTTQITEDKLTHGTVQLQDMRTITKRRGNTWKLSR